VVFYYASCYQQCPIGEAGLNSSGSAWFTWRWGDRCGWGVLCGLWDSVEARGAAAFINRDAEKAIVELEEHAVRS